VEEHVRGFDFDLQRSTMKREERRKLVRQLQYGMHLCPTTAIENPTPEEIDAGVVMVGPCPHCAAVKALKESYLS
jgi:hypothetical protein